MSESWRLFSAIELSGAVVERIASAQHQLARLGWSPRWTDPESAHLTLRFLGDTDRARVSEIITAYRGALTDIRSFQIAVTGAGVFPNNRRPRVVWIGMTDPGNRISRVRDTIESATRKLGFEAETRPFRPHITIGRVRKSGDVPDAKQLAEDLKRIEDVDVPTMPVTGITLFRSELTRKGPIYRALERFELDEPCQ